MYADNKRHKVALQLQSSWDKDLVYTVVLKDDCDLSLISNGKKITLEIRSLFLPFGMLQILYVRLFSLGIMDDTMLSIERK